MSHSPSDSLPYEIHKYSIEKLAELLASKAGTAKERVALKHHMAYFSGYFGYSHIDAQTIIVECKYVDKDYLRDYSEYYVSCFSDYKKTASRFHFFNIDINADVFAESLKSGSKRFEDQLQSSYLGFIVVKPLPETIIGRTCLKVYDQDGGRRNYTAIKSTEVNLFGFSLRVESLPFQEQDKSVAACATSALWSVFHATGTLFQHPIISPADITKIASSHAPEDSRYFPNNGLTLHQMAAAVRSVGLEPYKISAADPYVFKSIVFSYLKFKLPLVLGIGLYDICKPDQPRFIGFHAVAITGYSLPSQPVLQDGEVRIKAHRMDKIYVHDDQIGPFSRMLIDQDVTKIGDKTYFTLTSGWVAEDRSDDNVKAVPVFVLAPLYHKVRIPYFTIQDIVFGVGYLLEQLNEAAGLGLYFEWDIYLTTVNELKKDYLVCAALPDDQRRVSLLKHMPKYVWRVVLRNERQEPLSEFVFDATDIDQGALLVHRIDHSAELKLLLETIAKSPGINGHARSLLNSYQ